MGFLALLRLVTPREWALLAALLAFAAWSWHERSVGEQACVARVQAAQNAANQRAAELQAKIDHDAAAQDAGLQAAINAVPTVGPKIVVNPNCLLTPAQTQALREALK